MLPLQKRYLKHMLCSRYRELVMAHEGADSSCYGAAAEEAAVEEEPAQIEAPTAEPIVGDVTSVTDIEAEVPKEAAGADDRTTCAVHKSAALDCRTIMSSRV